jgi:hypothetical protein
MEQQRLRIGLIKQAGIEGVTLPPVTHLLCGTWNGVTYGYSDYTTCKPGSMLVVKNYFKLIGHHRWPIHCLGIRYAVYDIEPWSYTPSYQEDRHDRDRKARARLVSPGPTSYDLGPDRDLPESATGWSTTRGAAARRCWFESSPSAVGLVSGGGVGPSRCRAGSARHSGPSDRRAAYRHVPGSAGRRPVRAAPCGMTPQRCRTTAARALA